MKKNFINKYNSIKNIVFKQFLTINIIVVNLVLSLDYANAKDNQKNIDTKSTQSSQITKENTDDLSKDNNVDNKEFLIKIKDHKFQPDVIKIKANQSFKLLIENLDQTIEEFESDDLKKEKLVGANKKITINVQPLAKGEYKFYGDFHQKTAQGKIIVE